jgi:hypothetical protein
VVPAPRIGRFLTWLVLACAVASLAADAPQQRHPIQSLLIRYASSVPPEDQLLSAAAQTGAIVAVEDLLHSTARDESWPGAIIALGVISGPGHLVEMQKKLLQFMNGTEPFDCIKPCRAFKQTSTIRYWDREARLAVPLSLGYLARQVSETELTTEQGHALKSTVFVLTSIALKSGSSSFAAIPSCTERLSIRDPDDSCSIKLQLNAIRGLEKIERREAAEGLRQVVKHGHNPLVVSEAANALEQAPRAPK